MIRLIVRVLSDMAPGFAIILMATLIVILVIKN